MKYDKSKVKKGEVYPVKDRNLIFAGGYLRIETDGITCFQDISPYNSISFGGAMPEPYEDHGGVDVRASIGTPVYANKDLTCSYGRDDWGNKVVVNGRRMRHMDDLPTKTSFKKGEIVFYTGSDNTEQPHLHIGQEDGGDEFATFEEGKNMDYKYYFKVAEDFSKTARYYPKKATYKMKCEIETKVYADPKLTKTASNTPFKPGQIVISRYHSKIEKNDAIHYIHEIYDNQNGVTCYFAYKREL